MLKKFYSKRSGFTLVEIIVAFAVFSIMAAMIAQILELSISARNSNNAYALELARQEKILTVIQKDGSVYNDTDKTGTYEIGLTTGGTGITLGYQVKATDPTAENQAEGINYFLSPVDYACTPESAGAGSLSSEAGGADGMAQSARMDTRITGSSGFSRITIYNVVKDEFNYPDDSPFKLPAGHTRYLIECSASSVNDDSKIVFPQEDVPYAQYRLFFYFSDEMDEAKSNVVYEDKTGKYTKKVFKEAKVLDCGLINTSITGTKGVVEMGGLTEEQTSSGLVPTSYNKYTLQALGNSVRIGTPFTKKYTDKGEQKGVRFNGADFTTFYVEFEGDPKLTCESFGYNADEDEHGYTFYKACPQYQEQYDSDGSPIYLEDDKGAVHPSIYGGYLHARNYDYETAEDPKDEDPPKDEEE